MRDWRNFMVEVMADLGRTGNLTTDIYPLVKKKANDLGETLGETWEATVRARLEENSSDCPGSWNGQYDLFELREKGSGNWVLRNLSETSILNQPTADLDEDDEGVDETKVKWSWHFRRESGRYSPLAQKKKNKVFSELGKLECEVCEFDYALKYGERGKGFIECHHKVALHLLKPKTRTKLSDLALLCANCHRMVHKNGGTTIEELKKEMNVFK